MRSDVSVACPTDVICLDRVVLHFADGRRASDESVLVVMAARAIEVRMKAKLSGVALREKILPENICDQDLLIS